MTKYGNRLPVPKELKSAHFFYHCAKPVLDTLAVDCVVSEVKAAALRGMGNGPTVGLLTYKELTSKSESLREAMTRLVGAIKTPVMRELKAEVLACQWAMPHTDDTFEGSAFYSVVLHTGPYPYVLELLHTEQSEENKGLVQIQNTARELHCGDAFIFDPTTPHYAAPKRPHQEQLLILLQMELKDGNLEERQELLRSLPPVALGRNVSQF